MREWGEGVGINSVAVEMWIVDGIWWWVLRGGRKGFGLRENI
jgi:hypothetical protein